MSTTLMPFLYQTRTIQRRFALSRTPLRHVLHRNLSQGVSLGARKGTRTWQDDTGPDAIPFELPDDVEITEEESGVTPDVDDPRRSTITPTERDAFNAIFREIAARGKGGQTSPIARAIKERDPAQSGPTNIVIQDETKGKDARTSSNGPATFTATDRAEALERFPPSLQKAAMLAFGLNDSAEEGGDLQDHSQQKEPEESEETETTPAVSQADRKLRSQEQARVESKMRAAKTDFQLWDVMEKEVFSMVDRLGIAEIQHEGKGKGKGRSRGKLSMGVHGPLYSSHLLFGLRLLDQAFPRPSTLVMSVLPRIKQLGLASYVLGAPTSLYNALMEIVWNRYNDAATVFSLWDEMHHAGLSYDEDSRRILITAWESLQSSSDGQRGTFLQEVTSIADHEPALRQRLQQAHHSGSEVFSTE